VKITVPKLLLKSLTIMVIVSPGLYASLFEPVFNPTLEVTETARKIKVDGNLDPNEWIGASRADNFVEHTPGDQTKPPVETKAFITYDKDNIYVAFVCYDDPRSIRSTMSQRDHFGPDDNVGFYIDPFGNATWAYIFNVNPYGIQADGLWSANRGSDNSFDMVWESAARITDSGYQVEMSIPFASIRFPTGQEQNWKVDFYRTHPRDTRREYSWAAYDRNQKCWPCQWGTVSGMKDVSPGKGIEIIPSVVSYQSGTRIDPDNFKNDNIDGEISLNAKYAVSSVITAEAAYNPDFSQVESDAGQIDVNTNFALFYPEKRPFFQEGSDLYFSWINAIYTRSINDPQAAAKISGRANKSSYIYLLARDEHSPMILPFEEGSAYLVNGRSTSNIFRLQRSLGGSSRAGIILTDRRMDGGGSGTLAAFDGEILLTNTIYFQWEFHGTYTREPNNAELSQGLEGITFDKGRHTAAFDGESYPGHAALVAIGRGGNTYWLDLTYYERNPTFRADNGFEPNNNYREMQTISRYNFFPNKKAIRRLGFNMFTRTRWNFEKYKKAQFVNFSVNADMIGQTFVETNLQYGTENLRGVDFDRIWSLTFNGSSNPNNRLGVEFYGRYGDQIARRENPPVLGKQTNLAGSIYFKPIDRIRIEPSIEFAHSRQKDTNEELFKGYITRTRVDYQMTRSLSLRFITEYSDFSNSWTVEPLLTYRINPFSLFYIGSTFDYAEYENPDDPFAATSTRLASRQLFMKLQYLFLI